MAFFATQAFVQSVAFCIEPFINHACGYLAFPQHDQEQVGFPSASSSTAPSWTMMEVLAMRSVLRLNPSHCLTNTSGPSRSRLCPRCQLSMMRSQIMALSSCRGCAESLAGARIDGGTGICACSNVDANGDVDGGEGVASPREHGCISGRSSGGTHGNLSAFDDGGQSWSSCALLLPTVI